MWMWLKCGESVIRKSVGHLPSVILASHPESTLLHSAEWVLQYGLPSPQPLDDYINDLLVSILYSHLVHLPKANLIRIVYQSIWATITGWLINNRTLLPPVLQAGKFKIKALKWLVRSSSWFIDVWLYSCASAHGGRGEGALWGTKDLITSSMAHLQIPS